MAHLRKCYLDQSSVVNECTHTSTSRDERGNTSLMYSQCLLVTHPHFASKQVEDDDERGIVQLSIRISEALSDHPNGLSLDHRRCCAVTGDFVLHIKPG